MASSATLVGNVFVAADAQIDHGVVIESAGPPVRIGEGAIVLANSVLRSVGGEHRPTFPLTIGARSLVSPLCALAGCTVGDDSYISTGAIVLQGARLGAGTRVGAGALVHADVILGEESRVGMNAYAVPGTEQAVITDDVAKARELVAEADFFAYAFGVADASQRELHRQAIEALRREQAQWSDEPLDEPP